MRVVRVNHYAQDDNGDTILGEEFSEMTFLSHGVTVSVIDRKDQGISVTVNPSNEPYMHNIKVHEVAVSGSQIRVADARGSAL